MRTGSLALGSLGLGALALGGTLYAVNAGLIQLPAGLGLPAGGSLAGGLPLPAVQLPPLPPLPPGIPAGSVGSIGAAAVGVTTTPPPPAPGPDLANGRY